jgi:hypothetical protein
MPGDGLRHGIMFFLFSEEDEKTREKVPLHNNLTLRQQLIMYPGVNK